MKNGKILRGAILMMVEAHFPPCVYIIITPRERPLNKNFSLFLLILFNMMLNDNDYHYY